MKRKAIIKVRKIISHFCAVPRLNRTRTFKSFFVSGLLSTGEENPKIPGIKPSGGQSIGQEFGSNLIPFSRCEFYFGTRILIYRSFE